MKLKLPLLLECFMRFVSVFEASVLYQKSCLQCNNIISGFFLFVCFSRYICVKKKWSEARGWGPLVYRLNSTLHYSTEDP